MSKPKTIPTLTPEELKDLWLKVLNHWEENLQRSYAGELKSSDVDGDGCAFCDVFFNPFTAVSVCPLSDIKRCAGCPIFIETGKPGCKGTPWSTAWENLGTIDETTAVEAELTWLIALYEQTYGEDR